MSNEMKKMVEERKRQKAADRDAKLRVLRQIEEDKERRRMQAKGAEGVKEAEEKRKKANEEAAKAAAAPKRSYDECRLQVGWLSASDEMPCSMHFFICCPRATDIAVRWPTVIP